MIDILQIQQDEIEAKMTQYGQLRERNRRGIDVLRGCLCCSTKVFERDCHNCETYQCHGEVPDLVECAIYGR